jgi:hypothetical protein
VKGRLKVFERRSLVETTTRELKITLVVRVRAGRRDDEETAREVETLTLRALESAGLEPLSCGYGYAPAG